MKDKWKVLAVDQYFSHDSTWGKKVALYDALQACSTQEEVESTIRQHEAEVWEPFESFTDRHFPGLLDALASQAEYLEGPP